MKRMRGVVSVGSTSFLDVIFTTVHQIYGGAPLNDTVGNSLAAQGVPLSTVYGCTEVGFMSTFMRR